MIMGKKSKKNRGGLVYSTNPNYTLNSEDSDTQPRKSRNDRIRVIPEKKGRGGKTVTIVRGYQATVFQQNELAKTLKQFCGVGGSVKQGDILLQGDHVNRVVEKLKSLGFTDVKRAGG